MNEINGCPLTVLVSCFFKNRVEYNLSERERHWRGYWHEPSPPICR